MRLDVETKDDGFYRCRGCPAAMLEQVEIVRGGGAGGLDGILN